MAVIRAKRLWLNYLLPSLGQSEGRPQVDPQLSSPLYTVPQGKRAIVRTITLTLNTNIPPGNGMVAVIWISVAGQPTSKYSIFWYWFIESVNLPEQWRNFGAFQGQVVLHSGDTVGVVTSPGPGLHVHGSGHELNDLAA